MRKIKYYLLAVVVIGVAIMESPLFYKTYTVKVIFCDERDPIIIKTECTFPPNNRDIYTNKVALSQWHEYLNVCELKVLKEE